MAKTQKIHKDTLATVLFPDAPSLPDTVDIPLVDIAPNASLVCDAPSIAMQRSVKTYGILTPIVVIERVGDFYEVADGKRRIKAARLAGMEVVPARIYRRGWANPAALTLITNTQRSDNVIAEVDAITALRDKGVSDEEIARETGMPIATIRARAQLLTLIAPLMQMFRNGLMRSSVAEAAAKLTSTQQERVYAAWKDLGKDAAPLTAAMVRQGRQTQIESALATLPHSLFETPDHLDVEMNDDGRRQHVAGLIREALTLLDGESDGAAVQSLRMALAHL